VVALVVPVKIPKDVAEVLLAKGRSECKASGKLGCCLRIERWNLKGHLTGGAQG
jgi:hypothetical protein